MTRFHLTLPMIMVLNLDPTARQILKGRIVIHRENLYTLAYCTEEECRVLQNRWEQLQKSLVMERGERNE